MTVSVIPREGTGQARWLVGMDTSGCGKAVGETVSVSPFFTSHMHLSAQAARGTAAAYPCNPAPPVIEGPHTTCLRCWWDREGLPYPGPFFQTESLLDGRTGVDGPLNQVDPTHFALLFSQPAGQRADGQSPHENAYSATIGSARRVSSRPRTVVIESGAAFGVGVPGIDESGPRKEVSKPGKGILLGDLTDRRAVQSTGSHRRFDEIRRKVSDIGVAKDLRVGAVASLCSLEQT